MRVLLLDAAFSSAPIYNALLEAGHSVWVIGNRPNDVLAVRAGERWIKQDYSQVDEVQAHIAHLCFDCVVPGCTDVSFETCAGLSFPHRNVDTLEITQALIEKQAFRNICAELDLPAPKMIRQEAFPRAGRYICKPVDAYSGRGVSVFDGLDVEAFAASIHSASREGRSGEFLIETFCEGALYSCSAFIENRSIAERFYVREGSSVNPYAVDTSYLVVDYPADRAKILENALEKLAGVLALADGLLHVQFIDSEDGPKIVEVMRRCPGDLYALLIEYSTGFKYAARYASYFTGDIINRSWQTSEFSILRHTVTSQKRAVFGGVRLDPPQPVRAFFPTSAMGACLIPGQRNRAGILFCQLETRAELVSSFEQFMSREAYQLG